MNLRVLTTLALSIFSLYSHFGYAEEVKLNQLSFSAANALFSSNNRELLLAKRVLESAQTGAMIAAQKPNPGCHWAYPVSILIVAKATPTLMAVMV